MQLDLNKDELINLVTSVKPSMDDCIQLTNEGKMYFCGNQHNENWDWNKKYLDSLSEEQLLAIYQKYKPT